LTLCSSTVPNATFFYTMDLVDFSPPLPLSHPAVTSGLVGITDPLVPPCYTSPFSLYTREDRRSGLGPCVFVSPDPLDFLFMPVFFVEMSNLRTLLYGLSFPLELTSLGERGLEGLFFPSGSVVSHLPCFFQLLHFTHGCSVRRFFCVLKPVGAQAP